MADVRDSIRRAVGPAPVDVDFSGPDPSGRPVGVVIPTFGRPEVLRRSLDSLARSDLSRCLICIVDETLGAPPQAPEPFVRLENVRSAGPFIERLGAPLGALAARVVADESCVAFDDSGNLLAALADTPTPMGNTRFSLYVKRSWLDARPALAARYRAESGYHPEPLARAHVEAFAPPGVPVIRLYKRHHRHMFDSLRLGLDLLAARCPTLMILDSDTVHHPDWVARTLAVHHRLEANADGAPVITSGFHTPAHPTRRVADDHRTKGTIGGLHMTFTPAVYRRWLRATLVTLGWDHDVCAAVDGAGGVIACTRPSVIQHIGEWGLWARPGQWMDRADDFEGPP